MFTRALCILVLSLVLAESRWHGLKRDNNSAALTSLAEEEAESREALRGKRDQSQRVWTEDDKRAFDRSHATQLPHLDRSDIYEVEVRDAQNSSLCNYTVTPVPNPGGRVPRDLVHVRCNHVGSKCLDRGNYCCIQTYRNVEVFYEDGRNETLKVYSGCVCSLLVYGNLKPYNPDLDLDQ